MSGEIFKDDVADFDGLNEFAMRVYDTLIEEKTHITPVAFSHMYERLLEEKSIGFKKEVMALLESEEEASDDTSKRMEHNIKEAFVSIRGVIQTLGTLYKNINLMSMITKQKVDKIKKAKQPVVVQEAVKDLELELSKLVNVLERNNTDIRREYSNVHDILKDVKENSKFNSTFDVYNRKYFDSVIKKEIGDIKKFNYRSSIVFVKVTEDIKKRLDKKGQVNIDKTLAKILLKRSKRSDILAYFDEGIFAILLKRTGIKNSEIAALRIIEAVEMSVFFAGDEEMEIKVDIGIANVDPERTQQKTYELAVDILPSPRDVVVKEDIVSVDS
jgi:diguanylate cyclase (GGDEF)-like protein